MKKLKLDLEDLKVDSFELSSESADEKGTVKGNAPTGYYDTCIANCTRLYTCADTCIGYTCAFGDTCPPPDTYVYYDCRTSDCTNQFCDVTDP